MGFTLARNIAEQVSKLAHTMGASEEATVIPDSMGMVLVRPGTKAFEERIANPHIFMIPVQLPTVVNGVKTEELFLVCSK